MRFYYFWKTPCRLFGFVALLSLVAFLLALFAQHVLGMAPCAWCVLQRVIVLSIVVVAGLSALAAAYKKLWLARLGALGLLLLGGAGISAAWHQYTVAAHSFSCAQSFADRFMQASGLEQALPGIFGIYANCMQAQASWLGLDFALWAFSLFTVVILTALLTLWRLFR